jgi:pimeloyl-ACP methyl ester carboxylesterase
LFAAATSMTIHVAATNPLKVPIAVDVSAAVATPGVYHLRGFVTAPADLDPSAEPPIVLCCLPGGRCSTGYFDLQVDGLEGYSMADHLTAQGFVVVALDHLGVGASSPVEDIFALTPAVASAVNHHAFSQVLAQLRAGSIVPGLDLRSPPVVIGMGHSMGGMLTMVQQANHRTYDAVINLGHGGDGLPLVLTPEELSVVGDPEAFDASIVRLARDRSARPVRPNPPGAVPGTFHAADVPAAAREAFVGQSTGLLSTCGLTSMIPGSTDREKGRIDTPIFLGFGDRDLTTRPHAAVAAYRASPDVTLLVIPGSGHCHHQAGNRAMLWDRVGAWAQRIGQASHPA